MMIKPFFSYHLYGVKINDSLATIKVKLELLGTKEQDFNLNFDFMFFTKASEIEKIELLKEVDTVVNSYKTYFKRILGFDISSNITKNYYDDFECEESRAIIESKFKNLV